MLASLLITFRETLEAALVVGIVLGYLSKINKKEMFKNVYYAVGAGIFASILGAVIFNVFSDGFEGRAEEIFEGITMLAGAALLTTMIMWIIGKSDIAVKITKDVDNSLVKKGAIGIFMIVFMAILREGIETVIFLNASVYASGESSLIGAIIGILIAIALSFLLFKGLMKISLKKFFLVTNILLILFAAGLVAHGLHELQEAKLFPVVIEHIWDVNPEVVVDGSYPALHEKGAVGSIFKGLFGYNGNPTLLETIAYWLYLISIIFIWKKKKK
ncbi:MAG: high-affinity iron transporter [Candidatus Cloacimonetes bacterium]|nr:high-affinity iron transporter [Candidatus Cloacimonadota bacterium]